MAIDEGPDGGQATGRRPKRRGSGAGNGGGRTSPSRNRLKQVTPYTPEDLLAALLELEAGDFSVRLSEAGDDLEIQIAQAFNRVAALNESMSDELARISRTVGREGESTDRAVLEDARGDWARSIGSVN